MRIDAHHHTWDVTVRDMPWTSGLPLLQRSFPMSELRPRLREHEIDATLVVQTMALADETADLLGAAEHDVEVSGVVGWVDLCAADVETRLRDLRALPGGDKLVGIRHPVQSEPDPNWLCRTDVRRGLAAVADAGLVYEFLVTPDQLGATAMTAQALPDARFVLDHAGKPRIAAGDLRSWADQMAVLAKAPNVAVKLSGLVTEADHHQWTVTDLRPYSEVVIQSFGPARVMFGSDWPVCLLAATYDDVIGAAEQLTAHLSESERIDVFGDTAARWYRLGVQ